jgi:hypothetical protein
VLSAENLLVNILKRAKELAEKKVDLFCTPALKTFLYKQHTLQDFISEPKTLETFALLDDTDIMTSVKVWATHTDPVLSKLCEQLLNRKLFKIELQNLPFKEEKVNELKNKIKTLYKLNDNEVNYFVFSGDVANDAYRADKISINILFKDGSVSDIANASDQLNIQVLAKTVKKYYLCYPKE